jgi:alkyl hydroperoxide reductase subunit AhpC
MVQSFANDFINVVDKNGQVKGILAYNSGLGKAVSSRVIVKMLEQLNLPQ